MMKKSKQSIKKITTLLILLILINLSVQATTQYRDTSTHHNIPLKYKHTPIRDDIEPVIFIKNEGQYNPDVAYYTTIKDTTVLLCTNRIVTINKIQTEKDPLAQLESKMTISHEELEKKKIPQKFSTIETQYINSNPDVTIYGQKPLSYYHNYFLGNDTNQWYTKVPTYQQVTYRNLWPGIDLVFYGSKTNSLKYDFIVHPGSDPLTIAMRYTNIDDLILTETGDLHILASKNQIVERNPFIFQQIKGEILEIDGSFEIVNPSIVQFQLTDSYDRRYPLVIDPELVYCSYLGSSSWDLTNAIAVDNEGIIYVTGTTASFGFPTTANAYDSTYSGYLDIFITKINPNLPGLEGLKYSTFIGGSHTSWGDEGMGIAVDDQGNIYITGTTYSDDYPLVNPYDDKRANYDAILTKLSPAGDELLYSTFLGGYAHDEGRGIAVDDNENAYITGWTYCHDYPTTPGCFDPNGNGNNAFISKVDTTKNGTDSLIYSTKFQARYYENARAITIDDEGNAFIIGCTSSPEFYTSSKSFDATLNGKMDTYVAKLALEPYHPDPLLYFTYLGGGDNEAGGGLFAEQGYDIVVDDDGYIYVTGYTKNFDFPTTSNAYDQDFNRVYDAYVTKLDPFKTGNDSLVYSTYLGGTSEDFGFSLALDSENNVYCLGATFSQNYPITPDAFDSTHDNPEGEYPDFFLTRLPMYHWREDTRIYSTFLGGIGEDWPTGIVVDEPGNIYLTGYTWSYNFPTTTNAFQQNYRGDWEGVVVKFLKQSIPPDLTITKPLPAIYYKNNKILPFRIPLIIGNITIMANASDNQSGLAKVEFYIDNGLQATFTEEPFIWDWTGKGLFEYWIKVIAYDQNNNIAVQEFRVLRFCLKE